MHFFLSLIKFNIGNISERNTPCNNCSHLDIMLDPLYSAKLGHFISSNIDFNKQVLPNNSISLACWPNGKALDYESRDCRFDPCVGQIQARRSQIFRFWIFGENICMSRECVSRVWEDLIFLVVSVVVC